MALVSGRPVNATSAEKAMKMPCRAADHLQYWLIRTSTDDEFGISTAQNLAIYRDRLGRADVRRRWFLSVQL